jgi:hypothetical protein
MNTNRFALLFLFVHAVWLCGAAPALAQQDTSPTQNQIFPLKSAIAADVAQVLRAVYGDLVKMKIAVDERTNSVIVTGPPAALTDLAKIIQTIDVNTAATGDDNSETAVFSLQRIDADQKLIEMLQTLLPNAKAGRFVVDPGRKLVLFKGPPALRNSIQMLIDRIEREAAPPAPPARGMQVRLLWLVGGKLAKGESVIPSAAFSELTEDLKRLHLDPMRIAGHTLVQVTPDNVFTVSGETELEGPCILKSSGKIRVAVDGTVILTLSATVTQARGPSTARLCDLQTEMGVPPGKLVLAGAAPVHGEPTAFIVHIVEAGVAPPPKKAVQKRPR